MSKDDPVQAVVDALTEAAATPEAAAAESPVAAAPALPQTPYEQEIHRAHLKQKFWIVRTLVLSLVFMTSMMATSIAYVYAVKGGNFEGTAVDSMFSNISELIKLFSAP